ncbi:hypothetical protein [Nostoc sp. NMS1]|uniref:DUF488 family protein, N3 subclade n=1 Tax=Nostoc sp. NMS1 TaxID=2815388 RepID=UPI0025F19AC9|nr:hypothetical protein [Nostoc sp. NMS1]
MTIFTSYYAGEIRGEAVSISLYPPKGFQGKHLPLFAPTPELLKWWKSSASDTNAEQEYTRQFHEILLCRQQLIDIWVAKQQQNSHDMTLCCYEKTGDFCHRHQVGREVIQLYLPKLWGGEVGLGTVTKQKISTNDGSKIILPATYPPQVLSLIKKCHELGYPVKCDCLECGYYQVSFNGEDLGVWSELGVLGVLSGLQEKFYRERLIPSVAMAAKTKVKDNQQDIKMPSWILARDTQSEVSALVDQRAIGELKPSCAETRIVEQMSLL